jgi:hypothetical protein
VSPRPVAEFYVEAQVRRAHTVAPAPARFEERKSAMAMDATPEANGRLLLALWSAPRSRSTAFERMMMERGDVAVLHEPFSHVKDFGSAMVGQRRVTSEEDLLRALKALGGRTFVKDTTDFHYPRLLEDDEFLRGTVHAFIIRHPREVIASHARLNPNLQREEIGFARLWEIYSAVTAVTGAAPLVIDSDDLLARPATIVEAYCRRVGIPFMPESLRWRAGTPQPWQRTERWHLAASESTGFGGGGRRGGEPLILDPVLAGYCDYHLPYYEALRERRLVPA